jgi:hypothetical protein
MAGSGAGLPYRARPRKAGGTSGASDVIKDAVTPEVSGIAPFRSQGVLNNDPRMVAPPWRRVAARRAPQGSANAALHAGGMRDRRARW